MTRDFSLTSIDCSFTFIQLSSLVGTRCCAPRQALCDWICQTHTYADAASRCAAAGGRLCTQAEIIAGDVQGTGCHYDFMYVWTSDKCGGGANSVPQNYEYEFTNKGQLTSIGKQLGVNKDLKTSWDGHMYDIQFIDGKQLTAADFNDGAYQGDYGLNGFHLAFDDPSNIGYDSSGNDNHFVMFTENGGTAPLFDSTMIVPGSKTFASGLYYVNFYGKLPVSQVFCDMDTDGGGWTMVADKANEDNGLLCSSTDFGLPHAPSLYPVTTMRYRVSDEKIQALQGSSGGHFRWNAERQISSGEPNHDVNSAECVTIPGGYSFEGVSLTGKNLCCPPGWTRYGDGSGCNDGGIGMGAGTAARVSALMLNEGVSAIGRCFTYGNDLNSACPHPCGSLMDAVSITSYLCNSETYVLNSLGIGSRSGIQSKTPQCVGNGVCNPWVFWKYDEDQPEKPFFSKKTHERGGAPGNIHWCSR